MPNIKKILSTRKGGISIFYEIYSDTNSVFQIEYDINEKDNTIISDKTLKELKKGRNQIFYTIPDSTLSMGNYDIAIILKDNDR